MGGHVLESWKEEMIRIGHTEGHAQGHAEGHAQGLTEGREEARQENYQRLVGKVQTKLKKGKSVAQIAEELEEEESLIQEICKELEK